MRVKVDPYLFPVTQCSRCWRFGHTLKMCPSERIFCPKCGGKHENCEVTTFKCINCTNNHLALDRSCPAYLKERKIREMMAHFNVSYRKAMTRYTPPAPPVAPSSSPLLPAPAPPLRATAFYTGESGKKQYPIRTSFCLKVL